jgi:hypothetical protein
LVLSSEQAVREALPTVGTAAVAANLIYIVDATLSINAFVSLHQNKWMLVCDT